MTLVNIGGLMRWPGMLTAWSGTLAFGTDATLDAATEYMSYVYQAREAMVISHVGWRTGVVAGSPTADTRIETVGTDGIPTGTLWAANTNLVSGTLVSNTFTLHALTASATMAKGDFFAIKVVYNSGTSFIVSRINGPRAGVLEVPYTVTNTTGSAVKALEVGSSSIALGSSTSAFYAVDNAYPCTTTTNNSFNNTSSARRGLRFQVPFTCRCAGLEWFNITAAGNFNAILFDDAGTELSSSSTAFEGNRSALSSGAVMVAIFDSPVTLAAGTWYRVAIEPSSATNCNISTVTLTDANYRSAWPGGVNNNYTTYVASSWTDTATDQLPMMQILIDQVDNGAGSGGGGGYPASRILTGM